MYFKVDPAVHYVHNDDGDAVLMNMETGIFFGLRDIGSEIWSLLVEGSAVEQIVETIASIYEQPVDRVSVDVHELLDELTQNGLIVAAEDAQT